jgi:hypothetical protein
MTSLQSPATTASGVFDVSTESRHKFERDRGIRNYSLVVVASMAAFAVFGGILLGRILTGQLTHAALFGAVILLVGSAIVAIGFVILYRATRQGPSSIVLSDEYILFQGSPKKPEVRVSWKKPNLKMTLYDMSSMERVSTRSGRSRLIDYAIVLEMGYQVALSKPAFEAILASAKRHHLRVDGDVGPPPVPDSARIIRISQP